MNVCHASGYNINIKRAQSTLSKFLPLARFRSSTPPMPRACRRLQSALSTSLDRFTLDLDCLAWSTSSPQPLFPRRCSIASPSTTSPSTASPRARRRLWSALSTPLDRFTLILDHFAWSTSPPPASEHAVDLDRFARRRSPCLRLLASSPPPACCSITRCAPVDSVCYLFCLLWSNT